MKKIVLAALFAAMLLISATLTAQNSFKGIVKYEVKSTGEVAVNIKPENATMEIKVMGDKLIYQNMLQEGMKITANIDLSQAIAYLAANDIELASYTGDGKLLIEEVQTKESVDSLYIPDTEPEHYYIENIAGETNKIQGFTCKKAVMHRYDDEGTDHPTEIWYCDEIGPEYNFLFSSANIIVKGMPLQFTIAGNDGKAITYTATSIVKGKVKEVDFLLPSGFKKTSQEEFTTIMQEIQDAAKLLE
ncbi:MAG: hypothetical protein J6X62_06970 [Bacteroidales bacterium]|nr:hypothetical protein [Bacteroidales bacterium]